MGNIYILSVSVVQQLYIVGILCWGMADSKQTLMTVSIGEQKWQFLPHGRRCNTCTLLHRHIQYACAHTSLSRVASSVSLVTSLPTPHQQVLSRLHWGGNWSRDYTLHSRMHLHVLYIAKGPGPRLPVMTQHSLAVSVGTVWGKAGGS